MTPINKEEGIVVKDTIDGNETKGKYPTRNTIATTTTPATLDVEGLSFGRMKFLETQVSALSCEVHNSSFHEASSPTTPKEIMKEDSLTLESSSPAENRRGITQFDEGKGPNRNDHDDTQRKNQQQPIGESSHPSRWD